MHAKDVYPAQDDVRREPGRDDAAVFVVFVDVDANGAAAPAATSSSADGRFRSTTFCDGAYVINEGLEGGWGGSASIRRRRGGGGGEGGTQERAKRFRPIIFRIWGGVGSATMAITNND